MISSLISGLVQGLIAPITAWWKERQARIERDRRIQLEQSAAADIKAQIAEKDIEKAAKQGRDGAVADFDTLR